MLIETSHVVMTSNRSGEFVEWYTAQMVAAQLKSKRHVAKSLIPGHFVHVGGYFVVRAHRVNDSETSFLSDSVLFQNYLPTTVWQNKSMIDV